VGCQREASARTYKRLCFIMLETRQLMNGVLFKRPPVEIGQKWWISTTSRFIALRVFFFLVVTDPDFR